MMNQKHKAVLQQWIKELQDIPRHGTDIDEPEGQRFVEMSDTFVNKLTADLQIIVDDADQGQSQPRQQGPEDGESWKQFCERKR